MRTKLTRVASAAAILAAGTVVGLISTNPAAAAPALGSNTLTPASGNSGTTFTLLPPSGVLCSGAGTAGYRWQTYMVSASVDASTLTFSSGPNAVAGAYVQPLYDAAGGNPVINKLPSSTGQITGIPTISFASLASIPPPDGNYKMGFACTLSGAIENGKYWETTFSLATSAGAGPVNFIYGQPVAPAAPVLGALTAGNGTLAASFTSTPAIPAISGYTVTAVPTAGTTVTQSLAATATSFSLSGLSNGTSYSVTVTATNGVGTSVASNAQTATPTPPTSGAPSVTATSGVGSIVVDWTPATVPSGATLVNHIVTVTPAVTAGSSFTVAAGTNTLTVSGAPGTYSFTVQATYTPSFFVGAASAPVSASINSAQTLIQDLTVVRPVGALVLTQRCGVYGSAATYTDTTFGTLAALPASPANADPDPVNGYAYNGLPTGTPFGGQPSLTVGGAGDPLYAQYPYPTLANGDATATYPTHCGIDLGTGKLITSGPRAGQYFTANGRMAQLTVVNTQDIDNGFTINGQMSAFTRTGGGDSFSGNLLGWNPEVTYDSSANLDGYDMVVTAGGVRQPSATSSTTGLGAGTNVGNTTLAQSLAQSSAGSSLGLTVLDARLRLLIPVAANSGTYTGTLTFTTV